MRELGYVEGRNLVIEWRSADGKAEPLPALAAELVRLGVDAIVVAGGPAASAARKATSSIPIILGSVNDPVGSGLAQSLARPGGNITGLSNFSSDLAPKQLDLLLETVPKLSRVALLVNFESQAHALVVKSMQDAAQKVQVTVIAMEARSAQGIEEALARMTREKVGAMIVASYPLFTQHRREIAQLALKYRMPIMCPFREYVEDGNLMSYGYNPAGLYRHAAIYADKIFKGAKPADLPIEQPTTFEMAVNLKTAKALGIRFPQSILLRADRVIE
ncbi:MAG: ABC transporter substrate-binding protein [Betaproteobacteria bacterium]|nr:ABC transporter substrate-binding protein [Betaproteobacteria bacterium]